MHKVCAFVTIIQPLDYVNYFVADAAKLLKIVMVVRNGVQEIKRMMVIVGDGMLKSENAHFLWIQKSQVVHMHTKSL